VAEAIVGWFLSQGVAALLGFASKMIADYLNAQRRDAAVRERERSEQLEAALEMQRRLAEEAAKRVSEDDALRRMEEGSA
jgi:hypothetical protein